MVHEEFQELLKPFFRKQIIATTKMATVTRVVNRF